MDYAVLKSCDEVYRIAQSHVVNVDSSALIGTFA